MSRRLRPCLVTDLHGNPVSGIAVNLSRSTPVRLVTAAARRRTQAVSRLGSWTLVQRWAQTAHASSTGLSSVKFKRDGHRQHGFDDRRQRRTADATGHTNGSIAPSVKVKDTDGNSVSGVSVTFAGASGGRLATR